MKRIKMLLYGEPGVGKSVFASKAPKPFFITTDGNYEWLEDFGADPRAHAQVSSWAEAKAAFAQPYDDYETIVVDLLEDMFKWCEYEYCTRTKIEHISDIGYGKGYDITRNEFFLEISKLLGKDKNIILITHGITFVTKDRRGVEHTKYAPSNRIPDKVLDMIEGRLRYCLRCYLKAEEQSDGTILKKRYLSVVPKENEFGIARGLDEDKIPHDIELEFSEFAKVIGLEQDIAEEKKTHAPKEKLNESINVPNPKKREEKKEVKPVPMPEVTVEEAKQERRFVSMPNISENVAKQEIETIFGIAKSENTAEKTDEPPFEPDENPKVEQQKVEQPVEQKPVSNIDKLAAIKAKLAALKNQK
jgi:hypothetical protein